MVMRLVARRFDDLDGTELDSSGSPVRLTINDVSYEVDLSPEHLENLINFLHPFLAVARKQVVTIKPSTRREEQKKRSDIRSWARARGYAVSERGRISRAALDAYRAAAEENDNGNRYPDRATDSSEPINLAANHLGE